MDIVQIIEQLISNVGFPIAAFIMIWLLNRKTTEAFDNIKEAFTDLKETVASNTVAINELKEKIK